MSPLGWRRELAKSSKNKILAFGRRSDFGSIGLIDLNGLIGSISGPISIRYLLGANKFLKSRRVADAENHAEKRSSLRLRRISFEYRSSNCALWIKHNDLGIIGSIGWTGKSLGGDAKNRYVSLDWLCEVFSLKILIVWSQNNDLNEGKGDSANAKTNEANSSTASMPIK